MKAALVETADSVFIENIPRLAFGKNRDNSFVRSSQLSLNALGEDYSYDFLMGTSGAAFRLHFHPVWCPSSADATTGFDVSGPLLRSVGYKGSIHSIDDKKFKHIKSLYKKIKVQINKGVPIVAINLKVCPEWGIITGYLKNKPGILCRTYFDESDEYSLAEHAPWLTFYIGEKGKQPVEDAVVRNSLKMAVLQARTEKFKEYKSGFSAFEYWIDELGKMKDSADEKLLKERTEVNVTIFYILLDARWAAVNYLESVNASGKFKIGGRIIDNYKTEVRLLNDFNSILLPSFQTEPIILTEDLAGKQIDVLSEALLIEKETIGLIEEVLTV